MTFIANGRFRWISVWCLALALTVFAGCQTDSSVCVRSGSSLKLQVDHEISLAELFPEELVASKPSADTKIIPDAILAYFQAKEAIFDENPSLAVSQLKTAIDLDPNYFAAHKLLMQLAMDSEQMVLAQKEATLVLELAPADPEANYVFANLMFQKNQLEQAALHFHRALIAWDQKNGDLKLQSLLASFRLGETLDKQGYFNAAIEVYQSLENKIQQTEIENKDRQLQRAISFVRPTAYLMIARSAFKLKRYNLALEYFEIAKTIKLIEREASFGMIQAMIALNQIEKAKSLLNTLAEAKFDIPLIESYQALYPKTWQPKIAEIYLPEKDNIQVGLNLARDLIKLGKHESAITLLKKIMLIDPANNQAIWLAVSSYQASEQFELSANFLLNKIVDFKTIYPPIKTSIASDACRKIGAAVTAISSESNKAYAKKYLLAMLAQMQNDTDRAIEYYEQTIEQKQDFAPAYYCLAKLYLENRNWLAANDLLTSALQQKQNQKNAELYFLQGQALTQLGLQVESLQAFESANKNKPNDDKIILALVETYLWAQDSAKAVEQLKHLVRDQLAGPATLGRIVELMLESQDTQMPQPILQQYIQRTSPDAYYNLLSAKLEVLKTNDYDAYAKRLSELDEDKIRPGLLAKYKAELAYELKDFESLAEITSRALASFPKMQAAEYKKIVALDAIANWRLLNYDRSRWAWQELINVWPTDKSNSFYLEQMLLDAQKYQLAIPLLQTHLKENIEPKQRLKLRKSLINAYVYSDQLLDAFNLLDRWCENASPDDKKEYLDLKLEVLIRQRLDSEAIAFLEDLIEQKQEPIQKWQSSLATIYFKNKDYSQALKVIDDFQISDANLQEEFFNSMRIPILLAQENYDQAIDLATQALATQNPNKHLAAVFTLIDCYFKSSKFEEAKALALKESDKFPSNSNVVFLFQQQIVRSMILSGEASIAEAYILDKLAQANDEMKNSWQQMLVAFYFDYIHINKAIMILEDILADNPKSYWAMNSLGYALAEADQDLDRSEKLIRKALTDQPSMAAYLDSLAWVLYRKQNYEQAYNFAIMAQRNSTSQDPVLLDHLAQIAFKLGDVEDAKSYWRQAIEVCEKQNPTLSESNLLNAMIKKLKKLEK